MSEQLILVFVELIVKYGAPAALRLIKDWEVTEPTLADIEALRDRVPPPESYFEPK